MKRWFRLSLLVLMFLATSMLIPAKSDADFDCEAGVHEWSGAYCRMCSAQREVYPYGEWSYVVLDDGSVELVEFNGIPSYLGMTDGVEIPDEICGRPVTSIGAELIGGFYQDEVNAIVIPDSITSIGSFAFGDNPGVTTIYIPDSVILVGDNPFAWVSKTNYGGSYCPFVDVRVSENHPTLSVVDGVLYDFVDMRLIYYPAEKEGTTFTIPSGIREIGAYAFKGCSFLREINIPDSVTTIGSGAFADCKQLKEVCIPAGVSTVKGNPFLGTDARVTVSPENTALKIVNGCLISAADGCLISYLPTGQAESCTVPEGIKKIGQSAFEGCKDLTEVVIPEGVTEIARAAFASTGELEKVTLPSSLASIGNYAFYWAGLTNVEIPDGVTSIGHHAFEGNIFSSIRIPGSVKEIGAGAFGSCWSLQKVTLEEGVASIGDSAFQKTALKQIQLPDSITFIGATPFSFSTSQIKLPASHPVFEVRDDALIDKKRGRLIYFSQTEERDIENGYEYTIPDGIREIDTNAFAGAYAMVQVTIPAGVTSIKDGAFSCCSRLEQVTLPPTVTSIGNEAFFRCALNEVTIPAATVSIGAEAFRECENLERVSFSEGLQAIGGSAFQCCHFLGDINLPDSVRYVSNWAFYCYYPDKTITLGSNLRYIGSKAFKSGYIRSVNFLVERGSFAEGYLKSSGYTPNLGYHISYR